MTNLIFKKKIYLLQFIIFMARIPDHEIFSFVENGNLQKLKETFEEGLDNDWIESSDGVGIMLIVKQNPHNL